MSSASSGLRASKILNSRVSDESGEPFGSIAELMLGGSPPEVQAVIVARDGPMTAANNYCKLAWNQVDYDPHRGRCVLAFDVASIDDLPHASVPEELD